MTTDNRLLNQIPITHTLLACATSSILTSLALFYNLGFIVFYSYIAVIISSVYQKKLHRLFTVGMCILFSMQIFLKIEQLNHAYNADQIFLNCPATLYARILQKQLSQLNKAQTTLTVESLKIEKSDGLTLTKSAKILLQLPLKRSTSLHEGQIIKVNNICLQQPEPSAAYTTYLIKEGVWATAFITKQKISILQETYQGYYTLTSRIMQLLNNSITNLFNPLFLGKREKTISTLEIQHQSLYWGIAHHMARSGIHLVSLFGLFMALFHYARVKHFYRYIICTILMIGYLEISIPTVSFLRSICMILFQMISKINKFQYSSIHALTLTTLMMLLHNPYYILFLDFQLSFGITAIIIWLFHAKWSKTVAFELKTHVPS